MLHIFELLTVILFMKYVCAGSRRNADLIGGQISYTVRSESHYSKVFGIRTGRIYVSKEFTDSYDLSKDDGGPTICYSKNNLPGTSSKSLQKIRGNSSKVLPTPSRVNYGYFACPFDNDDSKTYCCGPENEEYCCGFTEGMRRMGLIIGLICGVLGITLISVGIPCLLIKLGVCKSIPRQTGTPAVRVQTCCWGFCIVKRNNCCSCCDPDYRLSVHYENNNPDLYVVQQKY